MPDFRQHIKAGFTKVRSAFLRYTRKEYAIVGKVLEDMATSRIHSIKTTKNSSKTTKIQQQQAPRHSREMTKIIKEQTRESERKSELF